MPAVLTQETLNADFIGSGAASRLLQLSDVRVRQLSDAGVLPALNTPLGRLYRRSDVATLAEQRSQRHTPHQTAEDL